LGGRAPPIPNCFGRFSNRGLTTFPAVNQHKCTKTLVAKGKHTKPKIDRGQNYDPSHGSPKNWA